MDEQGELIASLDQAQRELTHLLAKQRMTPLLETTLPIQQLKLLMLLRLHGPLGGADLTGHLGVRLPTVSGIVDRMVERGLLVRREDALDRRVRLVDLSPTGTTLAEEFERSGMELRAQVLEVMALEDLRALAAGMSAFVAGLRRVTDDAEQ